MRKIALITGSNQGIGYATAQTLLENGVTVILTSRDEEKGLESLDKLKDLGEVHFCQLDITDMETIKKAKKFVEDKFGKLDILINNAAINYDTWHSVSDANLDEIEQTLDANLMGAWRVSQTFLPLLKKADIGNIVNVSSGGGSLASQTGGTPGYSISKLALNALTMQLSNELRKDKILVTSVCLGWVRTSMGGMAAPRSAKSASEGIVWLALLEDMKYSGKFYRDKKEINW